MRRLTQGAETSRAINAIPRTETSATHRCVQDIDSLRWHDDHLSVACVNVMINYSAKLSLLIPNLPSATQPNLIKGLRADAGGQRPMLALPRRAL